MTAPAGSDASAFGTRRPAPAAAAARLLVERFGGRFSQELGIDVDRGGREIERWFLAATLFGTRISAAIAMRTYRTLAQAGVETIADVDGRSWEELVALLDAGGYVRYDFRTATRLQALAAAVSERTGDGVLPLLEGARDCAELERTLDDLPGWGPTTIRLFLRELRGVVPAAAPALDGRAGDAAVHLGLVGRAPPEFGWLAGAAAGAGVDPRDLEAALVRLALAHGRAFASCPGGARCRALASQAPAGP